MRLGLGCVNLGTSSGGRSFRADVRFVQHAIDQGITVLDTANTYGNGLSERIVGQAVRSRRDTVEIATKGGYRFRPRTRAELAARRAIKGVQARLRTSSASGGDGGSPPVGASYESQDFSPAALRHALEGSLRRLRTDHVDVYQLHGPSGTSSDVIEVLRAFVAEGKVRRLGVGAETLDAAARWSTVPGIDVVQLPVGILDPEAVAVTTEVHRHGPEVWARGVFGGGVLATALRGTDALRGDPKEALVESLRALGLRHDLGLFDLAFGFVRAIPAVSTILLGMSTAEHLRRNLAMAAAPPLAAAVRDELDVLLAQYQHGAAPR